MGQNDLTTKQPDDFQMINLKSFARRLDVCPNTIRNWMDSGKLSADRHYLRSGRIIRFPWSHETIERLMKEWSKYVPSRPKLKSRTANKNRLRFKA